MPSITFQPHNKTVQLDAGSLLSDAARLAGIDIDASCGGTGTCGKCAVRVVSGSVEHGSLGILSRAQVETGMVLACASRVSNVDLVVEVASTDVRGGKFSDPDHHDLIDPGLLPTLDEISPVVVTQSLEVPPPQLADGLSDLDRLTRSIDKSGIAASCFSLSVLRGIAAALRADGGRVDVVVSLEGRANHVVRVTGGSSADGVYGIAVDIGTTTVAVQLVEMSTGRILATRTDYNGQISCGLDVIGRINFARTPQGLADLRGRVLATVDALIGSGAGAASVDLQEIAAAWVSGNTTMLHLLLGLTPEYIRLAPYTPTAMQLPQLSAGDIGIGINPSARVFFSPCVGSYVGGDITAGLLCTDLARGTDDVCLFLDIGTNGEIALGNDEFLLTCACSAGPAFEGGGILHGMRAAEGAVDRVIIGPPSGAVHCSVIGNAAARGICGSGLISLAAGLLRTGWMDASGRFDRARPCDNLVFEGRQARYYLTGDREDDSLCINEADIENLLRAKAAIFAACALLLRQVGLDFRDVARFYIAGGFGRFLDIEDAITIGLLPDMLRERFRYLGNASLAGSYMALISAKHREKQRELAGRMTYVELNTDPSYMDQYTAALFFPHTDAALFPTIRVPGR